MGSRDKKKDLRLALNQSSLCRKKLCLNALDIFKLFQMGKKIKVVGLLLLLFLEFFFIDSCIYRNRCIFLSFFFWLLANAQSFCVFVMAGKGTGGGEGGGGGAGGVVGGKEKLSE